MRNRADFESVHRYSSNNRSLLASSKLAGCFYCGAIYDASGVKDWVDGGHTESGELDDGVTALCPRCGIDSVLPDAAPIILDGNLLAEMREHWF
jgi:hypothetical protein